METRYHQDESMSLISFKGAYWLNIPEHKFRLYLKWSARGEGGRLSFIMLTILANCSLHSSFLKTTAGLFVVAVIEIDKPNQKCIQVKTSVWYRYSSVHKGQYHKHWRYQVLVRMCSTLIHCWWKCNMIKLLW